MSSGSQRKKRFHKSPLLLLKHLFRVFQWIVQNYLPYWVAYFVHGFTFILAGLCSYYVFLFSVMLNRCSPCNPVITGDDDAVSNCLSCPAAMRTGGSQAQNVALDWLTTLLYTFSFNLLVSGPIIVAVQVSLGKRK